MLSGKYMLTSISLATYPICWRVDLTPWWSAGEEGSWRTSGKKLTGAQTCLHPSFILTTTKKNEARSIVLQIFLVHVSSKYIFPFTPSFFPLHARLNQTKKLLIFTIKTVCFPLSIPLLFSNPRPFSFSTNVILQSVSVRNPILLATAVVGPLSSHTAYLKCT